MVFINGSDVLGALLIQLGITTFGTFFLTMFFVIIVLLIIGFTMRMPIELIAIIMLPLILLLMAYSSEFAPIGAAFILFLAFLFARWFFL